MAKRFSAAKSHGIGTMGLWLFRAGGGWLEVDTTVQKNLSPSMMRDPQLKSYVPASCWRMHGMKIGEHTILESMIADIAAEFTKYNEARKKDAKRLRERRRRQKKREKKKAMHKKKIVRAKMIFFVVKNA